MDSILPPPWYPQKMEDDQNDSGIFLFKTSKSKVSTESIFQKPESLFPENIMKTADFGKKWMQKFLKRITSPASLHKPIIPVSSIQLQMESLMKYQSEVDQVIEIKLRKGKKMTRGNRRHKIKTRRQRRNKKLKIM